MKTKTSEDCLHMKEDGRHTECMTACPLKVECSDMDKCIDTHEDCMDLKQDCIDTKQGLIDICIDTHRAAQTLKGVFIDTREDGINIVSIIALTAMRTTSTLRRTTWILKEVCINTYKDYSTVDT